MENKTFNLFMILVCRICFSNSSSLFMWTANTCTMNSQACRSEKGTCLGLICWQTMRPHSFFLGCRHCVGCSCLASEYSPFSLIKTAITREATDFMFFVYWRWQLCGTPRVEPHKLTLKGSSSSLIIFTGLREQSHIIWTWCFMKRILAAWGISVAG